MKNKQQSVKSETLLKASNNRDWAKIKKVPRFIEPDNNHLIPRVEQILTGKCENMDNYDIVEMVRGTIKYKLQLEFEIITIAKWLIRHSANGFQPDPPKEVIPRPDWVIEYEKEEEQKEIQKKLEHETLRQKIISGLSSLIPKKISKWLKNDTADNFPPDTSKEISRKPDWMVDEKEEEEKREKEEKQKIEEYERLRQKLISGLSVIILNEDFRMLFFDNFKHN